MQRNSAREGYIYNCQCFKSFTDEIKRLLLIFAKKRRTFSKNFLSAFFDVERAKTTRT